MWDQSSNPTYAVLYRQYAHHFLNALQGVPKPKPSPEPMQDTPLQRSVHVHQAQPAPSSPAQTPLPPIPEMPMRVVPVDFLPMPCLASNFINHTSSPCRQHST